MNPIVAIDPGTKESAVLWWSGEKIIGKAIAPNDEIVESLRKSKVYRKANAHLVIEQVESYGMPVGKDVFDTVFWAGRFAQAWPGEFHLLPRRQVKLNLCNSTRAKDSNVRQALIDRYGKPGTKKDPGLTYGVKSHLWAAFALAVTWMDLEEGRKGA